MEIDLFTLIAQIINFSILVFLLNKFLFKRIIKAMDERQAKIAGDLAGAAAKNAQSEELLGKNRAAEEKIKSESASMLAEAGRSADAAKENLLAQARTEAAAAKQSWERKLEDEKLVFLDGLRKRSGDFMFLLAGKALKDLAAGELARRIPEVFVNKINNIDPVMEKEIRLKLAGLKPPLKVISSFELDEPVKGSISGAIRDKFGYADKIVYETKQDAGGVEMAISGYTIAWTVKEYLDEMEEEINKVWKQCGETNAKRQ